MARINMQKFARELMGKQVRFSTFFKRVTVYPEERYDKHGRLATPTKTWEVKPLGVLGFYERTGWVVGVRYLQTGVRVEGMGGPGFDGEGDYDPPTFKETAPRKLAVLVAEEPTSRPLPVPMETIELLMEYVPPRYVDESWRKMVSRESESWPRDAKGRFARG
jgi:hypothetical protein